MIPSKNILNVCISIFFIAALLAPTLARELNIGTQTEEMIRVQENRRLTAKPILFSRNFVLGDLTRYPRRLTEYLLDAFPYRLQIISGLFDIQRNRFARQGTKGIYGKDGWLFHNDPSVSADTVTSFIGHHELSQEEFHEFFDKLYAKRQFFESKNVKYYFLIAPSKVTVHNEYLPDELRNAKGLTFRESFMDHYKKYILENSIPDFIIDPVDALVEYKKEYTPLYYPQDTHWNWMGRIFAGNLVCDRLRQDFPKLGGIRNVKMQEGLGWRYLVSMLNIEMPLESRGISPFPVPEQWSHIEGINGNPLTWPSPFALEAFYQNTGHPDGGINAIIVGDSFFNGYHPTPEILAFDSIFLRSRQHKYFNEYVYKAFEEQREAHPSITPDVVIEEIAEMAFSYTNSEN